jgi:hypothetical protein
MSSLESSFARANPDDVYRPGGVLFIAFERVGELIDEAERRGVRVLGFEAFLVDGQDVYPSISRITDYSGLPADETWKRARQALEGEWRLPPTSSDQMNSEAKGRYMIAVTLDEPSKLS